MLALLTLIGSVGLADSVDPTMILPALYFARGRNSRRRVAGFAAGVFVVNVVGGVAVALGPGRFLLHLAPHPGPGATRVLELIGGAILVPVAVVLWRRRPRAAGEGSTRLEHAAPLVGATIALLEFPTAVPFFVIVVAVIHADVAVAATVGLLAAYQLLYLLPVLVIAVLSERSPRPDRAPRFDGAQGLLVRYEHRLIAAAAFAGALILLALGASGTGS
jgi:cytochrome c biogenesis protein CcdA